MNYDYTIKIDITRCESDYLASFLLLHWGMKPTIKKSIKSTKIICHGYSLQEKVDNKRMILKAIQDFRQFMFGKN